MRQVFAKGMRRAMRRSLGPVAANMLHDQDQAIRVFAEVLTRGFVGRFRWLFLGR